MATATKAKPTHTAKPAVKATAMPPTKKLRPLSDRVVIRTREARYGAAATLNVLHTTLMRPARNPAIEPTASAISPIVRYHFGES